MSAAALPLPTARPDAPTSLSRWVPVLLAAALAVVLTAGRAWVEWPRLSIFRLPDNDDMMRLAEVRDWLAGQRFNDLTQHRLGLPPGASMHWSRIADAGPALLIAALTPLLGAVGATLAMLVLYQGVLLFAFLLLSGRIARHLAGATARTVAILLAALAFPTLTLFQPGRIDHHALQIVLTTAVVLALVAPASARAGALGGVAAGLSLAVGLEVAPEFAVAIGVFGLRWIAGGPAEDRRLGGFAAALGGTTLLLLAVTRPEIWPAEWCDGFTPASTRATLAGAGGLLLLALAGRRLPHWRGRLLAAALVGAAAGAYAFTASRVCFSGPYGAMDPFVKRAFMDNVTEARGLFVGQDTPGIVVAYGGLCLASLLAMLGVLRDPGARSRWWPFALFLVGGVVAAVLQIRVTYIMAGIAVQPFAALLAGAPADRLALRLLLWAAGSGVTYNAAGLMVDRQAPSTAKVKVAAKSAYDCVSGPPLLALAGLPAGQVMAPMDSASYVIGMTPHRSFAAGYHRNNPGNVAMYRFFLSPPARARAMAARLRVDYVVTCPDSLRDDGIVTLRPGTLIEALHAGRTPPWLRRLRADPGGMMIYRVQEPPSAL